MQSSRSENFQKSQKSNRHYDDGTGKKSSEYKKNIHHKSQMKKSKF